MFVMIMIASTIMAGSLGVIAHRRLPDLKTWAVALGLQVVAYILLSLRGQISDVLSIVVANGCITASLALYGAGIYRFHGQRHPPWMLWVPLAVALAGYSVWMEHYQARVLFGGAIWLVQSLHLLVLVLKHRHHTVGRGQYIVAASAGVFAAAMVARWIVITLGWDHSLRLTDATPLVVLTYIASLSSTLLLAVGALTMIQERYEAALGDSEARYRQLIHSATVGIGVLQAGQLRFLNPKAREWLGWTESEALNRPLLPLIHPEDQALFLADDARSPAEHGRELSATLRLQTRLLGWRWMEVRGVPFQWHGEPATLMFLTDVTERHVAEDQIRDLAFHDPLTHLPNRRLLMEHLALARGINRRNGKHGALIFIDLDNFKPLNDRHGHAAGDLLLVEVAKRLLHQVRGTDTVSRFGGDEFVVLLTDLSEQGEAARLQAQQFAEKLRAVLEQPYRLSAPADIGNAVIEHRCTGTAGVVVFNGTGGPDGDLLDRADAAMYQAKQDGRNCVRMAP